MKVKIYLVSAARINEGEDLPGERTNGEKIAIYRERSLTERQYEEARDNINVRKMETFRLNNVRQGRKR